LFGPLSDGDGHYIAVVYAGIEYIYVYITDNSGLLGSFPGRFAHDAFEVSSLFEFFSDLFRGYLLGFGVFYLVTVRYATFQLAVEARDTCVVSVPQKKLDWIGFSKLVM